MAIGLGINVPMSHVNIPNNYQTMVADKDPKAPATASLPLPISSPDAKSSFDTVMAYEQAGDFASALRVARDCQKKLLSEDSKQDAGNLPEVIAREEKSLLAQGYSRLIFDEQFKPRAKVLELLEIVGRDTKSDAENTVIEINKWAQANLLRQGERWQEQTTKFEAFKQKAKPILTDLNFVDGVSAHFTVYEGAMVYGALFTRVRHRLYYLAEQWKQGVRFTDLYFLGSERPLEAQYENKDAFTQDGASLLKIRKDWIAPAEFPKTECEMMRLVWEQAEIPEDMRKEVHVHFINAPMKKDPKDSEGKKLIRPTTDDTVEEWLKLNPPHGRYLAVSNAPYINRQDLVLRTICPPEYGFDTIGPQASDQEKMAIFLDELARLIFQIKQLSEKQAKPKIDVKVEVRLEAPQADKKPTLAQVDASQKQAELGEKQTLPTKVAQAASSAKAAPAA